jgi:hypothetical protein
MFAIFLIKHERLVNLLPLQKSCKKCDRPFSGYDKHLFQGFWATHALNDEILKQITSSR